MPTNTLDDEALQRIYEYAAIACGTDLQHNPRPAVDAINATRESYDEPGLYVLALSLAQGAPVDFIEPVKEISDSDDLDDQIVLDAARFTYVLKENGQRDPRLVEIFASVIKRNSQPAELMFFGTLIGFYDTEY